MKNVKRLATLAVASAALFGASLAVAAPASADTASISNRPSSGRTELRAGNSVKQIAAGGQDTAGQ